MPDDVLFAALEAARLDRVVDELPDGLDTRIGESGAWLSGGQRHRLALARTLLVDAPLLVLDEVVVIDGGRIVARGHHDQLMASDRSYAARFDLELPVG